MYWVWLIVLIVTLVVIIILLNRFYRKASREVALIRTGLGGQKIITDGGFLALPFLHRVSEVNMKTTRLEVVRNAEKSVITVDRLRVDATVEFYVRVDPSDSGVATAAQALAGKTFRSEDLAETLEGKLVDAILSVAANYTMDELQNERGRYVGQITEILKPNLSQNGLLLESVSLTRLDQAPFHTLDENNAFNAIGLQRLAEIVASSKKERAVIEADADVAVRMSKLDATKKRLNIDQEEEEAQIQQQLNIERERTASDAAIAEEQSGSEQRREFARIEKDKEVKAKEIQTGREVRKAELEATQSSELRRLERDIVIAAQEAEVARAQVAVQQARSEEIKAKEDLETTREVAAAERERALAMIRAREQAEVDETRVGSETGTLMAMAKAEAEATKTRADAQRSELLARAEGEAALIASENSQSDDLIEMKLHMRKLEILPDVVDSMVKPAEKIDSIRINHVTGFGNSGGGGGQDSSADKAVVNQVVDGVLSMALQLPAVKKLGEEIGVNIGDGIKGISDQVSESQDDQASGEPSEE
ncbi:MAG: flotillin [Acidiferrobacteraceae bacterium]|nr:flotillin [Acidiferrobacteraceae bacterium]MDP6136771.1 flotillin domain-containing protein [Arenicellales bacterium]|tara:strand:- start:3739 stop:5349 length:1611 start_codon:yes stop_codon:yes gene_type:complete